MSRHEQVSTSGARRGGFTLIELLVVIAIIALLISILLPALGAARETAKTVLCASNEKEIGTAMYQYTQDNDGMLPYGGIKTLDGNGNYQVSWDDLISSYLGMDYPEWENSPYGMGWKGYLLPGPMKVLICPSDDVPKAAGIWAGAKNEKYMFRRSYAVPVCDIKGVGAGHSDSLFCATSSWPLPANFQSYKLTDAQTPNTLLLVERWSNYNIQGTYSNVYAQFTNDQFCATNSTTPLCENGGHRGKWNYLFADDHVEPLSDQQTWGQAVSRYGSFYNGRWWSLGPWTRDMSDDQ